MDRMQWIYLLAGLGGTGLAAPTVWSGAQRLWTLVRGQTASTPATTPEFGSDSPPPEGTTAFNAAIRAACGTRTSEAFILNLLCQGVTIAEALALARQEIERSLPQ